MNNEKTYWFYGSKGKRKFLVKSNQGVCIRFSLLLLSVIGHLAITWAQNKTITFNYQSGLTSNEVHGVASDNSGKIWISTDKGLTSYDGRQFKRYGTKEGLATLFSWDLRKDSIGRIWLMNRTAPFTYIYNDSIHTLCDTCTNIRFNDLIATKEYTYISSCSSNKTHRVDLNNEIVVYDSVLHCINSQGKETWINWDRKFKDTLLTESVYHFGDQVMFLRKDKISPLGSFIEVWNTVSGEKRIINPDPELSSVVDISEYNERFVLVISLNGLYKMNLQTYEISPFNEEYRTTYKTVIACHTDHFGNHWFSDQINGLVFSGYLPDEVRYRSLNLKDEKVSHFFVDDSGSIQISTDLGTRFITKGTSVEVQKYEDPSDPIYHYSFYGTVNGKNLTYHGRICYFGEKIKAKKNIIEKWGDALSLPYDSEYGIFLASLKSHSLEGNSIAFGTSMGAILITVEKDTIHHKLWYPGYVFGVCIRGDTLYSVGLDGLRMTDIKTGDSATLSKKANFSHLVVTDRHIFTRDDEGKLYKFSKQGALLTEFNQYKDLEKIERVGDDELWGMGRDRLVRLDPEFLTPLVELTAQQGFTHPYKLWMLKNNGDYFLICDDGYYRFSSPKTLKTFNNTDPHFYISRITVDGKPASKEYIELSGEQNFVSIALNDFYFPFAKAVKMRYRINKGEWNVIDKPNIDLINLPYGTYDIEINMDLGSDTQADVVQLHVKIHNPMPYHLTIEFFTAVVVLISFLILAAFLRHMNKKSERLEKNIELLRNKEKMLFTQMKPHFLTNIFNTIQSNLFLDSKENNISLIQEIRLYLERIYHNQSKSSISLEEEMEFLNNYVRLEQRRIERRIHLISDESWLKYREIKVPLFILQPIVENAIWHGILPSEQPEGKITLEVKEEEQYYLISISDNGVGMGSSISTSGNAIAMVNIEERLALMDRERRNKYIFTENITPGTKITLYVAKNIKNNPY